MTEHHYTLGIDLGTSNSALCYWKSGQEKITTLMIPQFHQPGQLTKKEILPSVLYFPHDHELANSLLVHPWEKEAHEYTLGMWARERGSEAPDRFISSAKSWLCNEFVDRREKILPWNSTNSSKYSPVEALSKYLLHLRNSFIFDREQNDEFVSVENLNLVLTVPASFDEVARNLTIEAAELAGFSKISLLEEPQAAFYSWIGQSGEKWKDQVKPGELVLVCDVGGGTTDFSLISINENQGELILNRVSVGDHLLLGGDNMDLALAYQLKSKLESQGGPKIDRWQFLSLVNQVKDAKEALLLEDDVEQFPISVASKGSSLLAKTRTVTLLKSEIEQLILDGFFPMTEIDDKPKLASSIGIQELGLNYEYDPAISKHLARFLQRSFENCQANSSCDELIKSNARNKSLLPTAILFNGGAFKAKIFRERIKKLLQKWNQGQEIFEINRENIDVAVAHGATYLGRSKVSGHGIRIAAGTARSYYIGLESSAMAVPGIEPEVKGLCVAAQATEEGTNISLPPLKFGLRTGQEVNFRFFSSPVRSGDKPGDMIENISDLLDETANLQLKLPSINGSIGELVPVTLDAQVTEIGTLELSLKHLHSNKKWKLEFNVRPKY